MNFASPLLMTSFLFPKDCHLFVSKNGSLLGVCLQATLHSTCYPQVTFYSAVILILILRVDVVLLDATIKLLQSPPTKTVIIDHCHHCNPCQPLSKCITITTINIASSCSNKLKSPSTPPFSHTCIIMTLTLLYVQCDN